MKLQESPLSRTTQSRVTTHTEARNTSSLCRTDITEHTPSLLTPEGKDTNNDQSQEDTMVHQYHIEHFSGNRAKAMTASIAKDSLIRCLKAEHIGTNEKLTETAMREALLDRIETHHYSRITVEALVETLLKDGVKAELLYLGLDDQGRVKELRKRLCDAITRTKITVTTGNITHKVAPQQKSHAETEEPLEDLVGKEPECQEDDVPNNQASTQDQDHDNRITCLNDTNRLGSHTLLKCAKCDTCRNLLKDKELRFVVFDYQDNLIEVKDFLTGEQIKAALDLEMGETLNILKEDTYKQALASVILKLTDAESPQEQIPLYHSAT